MIFGNGIDYKIEHVYVKKNDNNIIEDNFVRQIDPSIRYKKKKNNFL